MAEYAVIFIGACLVNNLILDYLLGVYPGIAQSGKIETAIGMSYAMVFVLTIATLVSYPLKFYFLVPLRLEFLELISFVFIIIVAVLIAEKLLQNFKPAMHEQIAIFIPMTLVNCSALGIALLNVQQSYGLFGSLFFGLGSGVGFGLVIVTLSAIQERLEVAEVPVPFRGVAILLITLGIISMAFMGFNGIVSQ